MKKLWNCKRGSSIVEAAIVFPFIILVTLVIVTITIWFYEEEVSLSLLHINLWDQAQQEADIGIDNNALNLYAPTDPYGQAVFYLENSTHKIMGLPFSKIKGFVSINHERKGFFPYRAGKEHKGQIYIINEMDYIRCYDSVIIGE